MDGRRFWRMGQTLLLVAVIAIVSAGLTSASSSAPVPVALASVAADNGNENNDDATNDDSEDRILRGQVVELYPNLNPPEMLVAQVGGNIWVRVLKTDEIARNAVKVGDHVRLQGEYNRGIFETTEIEVTDRCCSRPNDNNDDDDD
jgi:hypothetical protein